MVTFLFRLFHKTMLNTIKNNIQQLPNINNQIHRLIHLLILLINKFLHIANSKCKKFLHIHIMLSKIINLFEYF